MVSTEEHRARNMATWDLIPAETNDVQDECILNSAHRRYLSLQLPVPLLQQLTGLEERRKEKNRKRQKF